MLTAIPEAGKSTDLGNQADERGGYLGRVHEHVQVFASKRGHRPAAGRQRRRDRSSAHRAEQRTGEQAQHRVHMPQRYPRQETRLTCYESTVVK